MVDELALQLGGVVLYDAHQLVALREVGVEDGVAVGNFLAVARLIVVEGLVLQPVGRQPLAELLLPVFFYLGVGGGVLKEIGV